MNFECFKNLLCWCWSITKACTCYHSSTGPELVGPYSVLQSMLGSYIRNLRDQLQQKQKTDRTQKRNKKEGQRPSPSLHTHQPGKESKEMTSRDLTCLQVNILGNHDGHREFTLKYTKTTITQGSLSPCLVVSPSSPVFQYLYRLLSTSHLSGQVSTRH